MPSPLREALQGAQESVNTWGLNLQQLLNRKNNLDSVQQSASVVPALNSFEKDSSRQLEAWNKNSAWTDEPPVLKVTVPKGTLCLLETNFQIGLPPDDLFDIITDPGNKHVFKNIKEVTYRKVLEDAGHRQLVEVEQSAIWRFLCFSGTLSISVFVDQNKKTHSVSFHLSKEGFMRRFEGTWDIKPIYVDAPQCALMNSPESDPACTSSRVASDVTLKQIVQPRLLPPPPISWYIRGISSKQTESLVEDLQVEAKNLREGDVEVRCSQERHDPGTNCMQRKIERQGKTCQGGHPAWFKSKRKSSWRFKNSAKTFEELN